MYHLLCHCNTKTRDVAQEWYLRGGSRGVELHPGEHSSPDGPPDPPTPLTAAWVTLSRAWADSAPEPELRAARHAAIDAAVARRGIRR